MTTLITPPPPHSDNSSVHDGVHPLADTQTPNKDSNRIASENVSNPGFVTQEPFSGSSVQVRPSQESIESSPTVVPSTPRSTPNAVKDTSLEIAPPFLNHVPSTKVGLLPVVTPTGEPRGKVKTTGVDKTFTLSTPLTPSAPIGGKLGAAISATAAVCGGNKPILPIGSTAIGQPGSGSNTPAKKANTRTPNNSTRLNKFVRRLHDMLQSEKDSGIVEWRRGLLVLHSTDAFARNILPKYFNTRNFKTFRRQLNYYGFVHVRSFSATGSTTTALWVNQDLAKRGTKSISSVLMLKRVEPSEAAKTAEGRRVRKEEAVSTIEDIGVSTRTLQLEQIRSLALQRPEEEIGNGTLPVGVLPTMPHIPMVVHCHAPIPERDVSKPIPSTPLDQPKSNSTTSTSSFNNDSADDAANLLLMLSKSLNP